MCTGLLVKWVPAVQRIMPHPHLMHHRLEELLSSRSPCNTLPVASYHHTKDAIPHCKSMLCFLAWRPACACAGSMLETRHCKPHSWRRSCCDPRLQEKTTPRRACVTARFWLKCLAEGCHHRERFRCAVLRSPRLRWTQMAPLHASMPPSPWHRYSLCIRLAIA